MSLSPERYLQRLDKERRRRRLARQAYASIYRRLAHLTPVVLACAGRLRAFPLTCGFETALEELAPHSVFAFETGFELLHQRRVLTGRDLHAYTTLEPQWHGLEPVSPTPSLVRLNAAAQPHLFLIQVPLLPPWVEAGPYRVVAARRLLAEYLGALGHRFDLLSVVVHALGGQAGSATASAE